MNIRKCDDGKYVVERTHITDLEVDENGNFVGFTRVSPKRIVLQRIATFDTETEANDFVSNRLDEKFRYAFLKFEDECREWRTGAFYRPICGDMVEDIKKDICGSMIQDAHGFHREFTYMSLEDQEKYKQKKLDLLLERMWKAFEHKNYQGSVKENGQTLRVYVFNEKNIEVYKNSIYYDKYKKELMEVFNKFMHDFVRVPPVIVEPTPPKNFSEAVGNFTYNMTHREKKTAPTLKDGWVVYIFFMCLEVIFVDTIGLWIPTTIIFILWRKKQIRKYNWEMNEYDKKHYDPWNNNL